jgi:cobQ/cobB/minD/parA nucleotide binding domain protein
MKVVTITSLKGGVGKSAIATLLADYLAYYGRVLLIDANRQGDTTKRFVYQENEKGEVVNISSEENLFENIFRKKPVVPLTVKENLDLLVATKSLKEVEDHIEHNERKNPQIFKRWLKRSKLSDYYDYVVIDTHNSEGILLDSFYLASDLLIAVAGAGRDEMDGAISVYNRAEALKNDDNLVNDDDEPIMKAKIVFIGNLLKSGGGVTGINATNDYLDKTKDNELFITNIWDRNIFRDAKDENKTVFDIMKRSKYRDKSYERYFAKLQESLETIKNNIDIA